MGAGIVLEELEGEAAVFGAEVVLWVVVTAMGEVAGNGWENRARESGDIG
jgi:hypothetical protein